MDRIRIEKLSRWFRGKKRQERYFAEVHRVQQMSAIPEAINRDLYLVEKGRRRVWAVFSCPCEHGHRIVANLSRQRRPYWNVSIRKGLANFWPSFWLKSQCKSHFWIRGSRIYWAGSDSDYDDREHEI
jgi:hypothetical protein